MKRDSYHAVDVKQAIIPVVLHTTEGVGAIIDTADYESVLFSVDVGNSGDTLGSGVYIELLLEHGNNSGLTDAAPVAQLDVVGQTVTAGIFSKMDAPAEDTIVVSIGYVGKKRYVRVTADPTGTHTVGTPVGAVVVMGRRRYDGTEPA